MSNIKYVLLSLATVSNVDLLVLRSLIKGISLVHVRCIGNIQQTFMWFLQHLAVVDCFGFHVNSSSPLLTSHTLPGTMTLEPCTLQLFVCMCACASCVHFLDMIEMQRQR